MSAPSHTQSPCPGLTRASPPSVASGKEDVVKPARYGRRKRRLFRTAGATALVSFLVCGIFAVSIVSLGPLPFDQARQISTTIVDRNGKLLRAYAMADGRWRLPVDAKTGVDPGYLKLLLAYEDRRFYDHHGVDP